MEAAARKALASVLLDIQERIVKKKTKYNLRLVCLDILVVSNHA
jgi:hypothetical protein